MDYRSPTDHTVQANGLRLHYLAWGDPAAPPLVLLHGAGNTAHTWDFCAPSLAERYWVLALDLRGHGESDWASDYSWSARVADTVAFLHALGRSRAALMGLSLGGMTAYMTAAQHPEVVERLVIVDIGPEIAPEIVAIMRRLAEQGDTFDTLEAAIAARRPTMPFARKEAVRQVTLHALKQLPDGRWTWRQDPALRAPGRATSLPSVEEQWAALASINCPTLIVRGTHSTALSRATAERMAQTIPNARWVEVPAAAHLVPVDNPAGFYAAVGAFL